MFFVLVAGVLGLASLWMFGTLARAQGDAGMNAMVVLLFALMFLGVVTVTVIVIGGFQSLALQRPSWATAKTMLPEISLVVMAVLLYQTQIVQPAQRRITEEWWQKELAHRNTRKDWSAQIPPQYQGIDSAMLDARENMRRQMGRRGVEVPRMVPPDVEKAIRNRDSQSLQPGPIPDRATQASLSESLTLFRYGAAGSWLVGALTLPWILRRRTPPTPV